MDVLLLTTRLSIIACRYMVPFYYKGENVKASEIAALYNFNVRSISPCLTELTKVGILDSRVGGKERGFVFAKDPKSVTLYDIVEALEGEFVVKCCGGIIKCVFSECRKCSIYSELVKAVESRKKILSSTTIYQHYENIKDM